MKKKHLVTLLIALTLLIGASIGAYLFFARVAGMKTEILDLANEVSTLKTQADRLVSLRQVANSTGDKLAELDKYFLKADGALGFVEYIENLSRSSGLAYKIEFFDVEQDEKLKEQGKELLKTSIRTTGTIKNTRLLLSLVESLPYNVKVTRLDLRQALPEESGAVVVRGAWSMLIDFTVVKIAEK